jgi:hypothetical protein
MTLRDRGSTALKIGRSSRTGRCLIAGLLGLLFIISARATMANVPQVALITFGPGEIYWERFGHDAIIVNDPAAGEAIVYNYGVFEFEQRNFFLNFARNHMQYRLIAEPLDVDLAAYAAEGRSVTVQMLDLTPAQARWLAAFLAWNARPENARYRYDYFLNNCTTKVRDALNQALGGALERQLSRQRTPYTYRFDAVRLMSPDFWLALGMDAMLGPRADRPLSLWQESFVPAVLSGALRHVMLSDAHGAVHPLVSDEQVVLRARLSPAPPAPPGLGVPFLIVGLTLAALAFWLGCGKGRFRRTSFALLSGAWWLVCGLSGLVSAGLWGLTDHWAASGNENLLLLDPACLLLPVVWWRAPRAALWLATLIAAAALISPVLRALPGLYQSNLPFLALAVPIHLSLALLAWHQHGVAAATGPRDPGLA